MRFSIKHHHQVINQSKWSMQSLLHSFVLWGSPLYCWVSLSNSGLLCFVFFFLFHSQWWGDLSMIWPLKTFCVLGGRGRRGLVQLDETISVKVCSSVTKNMHSCSSPEHSISKSGIYFPHLTNLILKRISTVQWFCNSIGYLIV